MTSVFHMRDHLQKCDDFDLAGIGIGPFNLSLAALMHGMNDTRVAFFDQKAEFSWHPGLLFPDATLRTSFLKDLVTPVQPTNAFSFLSYLVKKKRFYDFLAGNFKNVSRIEFKDYMTWVASQLATLHWGERAISANVRGDVLNIRFEGGRRITCRNLAIGTGVRPVIPAWASPHIGDWCFSALNYLTKPVDLSGQRVVVVGGGQTGAEVTLNLLRRKNDGPSQIVWISKQPRFSPLEEGGFVDQVFTPQYVSSFQTLTPDCRCIQTASQKLTADGLTQSTVDALYSEVYRRTHLSEQGSSIRLLPDREVFAIDGKSDGNTVVTRSKISGEVESFTADVVILATGIKPHWPEFLRDLHPYLDLDDNGLPQLDDRYRLAWDGPKGIQVFGLNMGLLSHGIVDQQMSLMAWRSAVIINRVLNKEIFDLSTHPGLVEWPKRMTSTDFQSATYISNQ